MRIHFWLTLFSTIIKSSTNLKVLNSRPIVGIVAHEISAVVKQNYPNYSTYIAASYVKAIESSAARVIPVLVDQNESYYRDILRSINGILLPGGSANHGPGNLYYDTVKIIYKIVKQINDEGTRFPILGICLGMEFLVEISYQDSQRALQTCNIFRTYLPIQLIVPPRSTVMYFELNDGRRTIMETKNVTYNYHIYCCTVEKLQKLKLTSQWDVTAVSEFNNRTFVASIEHKKYPIFGVQFHPEKIAYEWRTSLHSDDALNANRYFFDFFVNQTRMNNQSFKDSDKEYDSLIYNFPLTYTAKRLAYMEVYFDPATRSQGVVNTNFSLLLSCAMVVYEILHYAFH